MARKPVAKSPRAAFAALLERAVRSDTRPPAEGGKTGTYAAFAGRVDNARNTEKTRVTAETVSNWCRNRNFPTAIEPILAALPDTTAYVTVKTELRLAYQKAERAERDRLLERAEREPVGSDWRPNSPVHERAPAMTDDAVAAAEPMHQQIQSELCRMAEELAEIAVPLGNQKTWADLAPMARRFRDLVNCDPMQVPGQLGQLYPLTIALGQKLADDIRLQKNPKENDFPLETHIHSRLTSLVQIAAMWLRDFPSVTKRDDAVGKMLMRQDIFQPAREFNLIAREKQSISLRDYETTEFLAQAANAEDFLGQKAGNLMLADERKLYVALHRTLLAALTGRPPPGFEAGSPALQHLLATLEASRTQGEALAEGWPEDLRQALRTTQAEGQHLATAAPTSPNLAVPDDVEAQAREMILKGIAPPEAWHPFIRRLNFTRVTLNDVGPLSGLTALETLYLDSRPVSDVGPLSGLTALQTLGLSSTQVSDVGPLSGLTVLQFLDIGRTQVSDVGPLSGLTALQNLDLGGTQVSDVGPLSGLTALLDLDLRDTQVSDIGPLSGLTALQNLRLDSTQVSDVGPLSGLTALQNLRLDSTQVSDVGPLSSLTALEYLDLGGTQVSDVGPLSGLTALEYLDLDGTQVSDVGPLSGLTALQNLRLDSTQVSDVGPLSGLTALQNLYLGSTQVSDVGPLSGLTALQNLRLNSTQVSDVGPLSGLTALQNLYLRSTQVSDVGPLSGLTALQNLRLDSTQVSDVGPLSGLTALEYLDLDGTQVSDVGPLSGLTALQILDLTGTQVRDVGPLSGLTVLRNLNLRGTQVSDVGPLSGLTALQDLDLGSTQVSDVG